MRILQRFKRRKAEKVYELSIIRRADGTWEYYSDAFDKPVDGQIVLAALMLHVQAVSERTKVDGRLIIQHLTQIAEENSLSFYPAFEGL